MIPGETRLLERHGDTLWLWTLDDRAAKPTFDFGAERTGSHATGPAGEGLHKTAWAILLAMAARHPEARTQDEIGDDCKPPLSRRTVARWLPLLRERRLTTPLAGGGETITATGLQLVRDTGRLPERAE
jgi:hypothetical protein